jgi:Dolichyl-phosphate-mannose-protein mannosyltransferase
MRHSLNSIPNKKYNIINSVSNTFRFLFIAEKDANYIYWILGIITLCGLVLRMLIMIDRPIGYDEAYTFIYFASRPFKYILADYHVPNNHILNTILIGIAYRILGGHIWIVRLPAFVASLLSIPAAYFAARRFYTYNQALAASAVLAIYPSLIYSSANGRGYMLIVLFSFMLINVGGKLVYKQDRVSLLAFAIIGALGFYTVPIFLYPMAGVSLWVIVNYLISYESWKNKITQLVVFLGACMLSGLLVLILYSPVIIFGTGFNSIVNNETVTSRTWSYFIQTLNPRIMKTWADWRVDLNLEARYLLISGFLLSLVFYRKASNQKLPLQIFLFLAVAILLILQRVAPQPRIWTYLELFCLVCSIAGLIWAMETPLKKIAGEIFSTKILPIATLLFTIIIFTNSLMTTQSASAIADRTQLPEQYAAGYIAGHLKPGDTILSLGPVDMLTAYHLKIIGISYEVFYQRDHPVEFQNALVVLRKKGEFNTPKKVVEFYQLLPKLDSESAELVYEYGGLQVYFIQAKQQPAPP